jgi:hypothetical protein
MLFRLVEPSSQNQNLVFQTGAKQSGPMSPQVKSFHRALTEGASNKFKQENPGTEDRIAVDRSSYSLIKNVINKCPSPSKVDEFMQYLDSLQVAVHEALEANQGSGVPISNYTFTRIMDSLFKALVIRLSANPAPKVPDNFNDLNDGFNGVNGSSNGMRIFIDKALPSLNMGNPMGHAMLYLAIHHSTGPDEALLAEKISNRKPGNPYRPDQGGRGVVATLSHLQLDDASGFSDTNGRDVPRPPHDQPPAARGARPAWAKGDDLPLGVTVHGWKNGDGWPFKPRGWRVGDEWPSDIQVYDNPPSGWMPGDDWPHAMGVKNEAERLAIRVCGERDGGQFDRSRVPLQKSVMFAQLLGPEGQREWAPYLGDDKYDQTLLTTLGKAQSGSIGPAIEEAIIHDINENAVPYPGKDRYEDEFSVHVAQNSLATLKGVDDFFEGRLTHALAEKVVGELTTRSDFDADEKRNLIKVAVEAALTCHQNMLDSKAEFHYVSEKSRQLFMSVLESLNPEELLWVDEELLSVYQDRLLGAGATQDPFEVAALTEFIQIAAIFTEVTQGRETEKARVVQMSTVVEEGPLAAKKWTVDHQLDEMTDEARRFLEGDFQNCDGEPATAHFFDIVDFDEGKRGNQLDETQSKFLRELHDRAYVAMEEYISLANEFKEPPHDKELLISAQATLSLALQDVRDSVERAAKGEVHLEGARGAQEIIFNDLCEDWATQIERKLERHLSFATSMKEVMQSTDDNPTMLQGVSLFENLATTMSASGGTRLGEVLSEVRAFKQVSDDWLDLLNEDMSIPKKNAKFKSLLSARIKAEQDIFDLLSELEHELAKVEKGGRADNVRIMSLFGQLEESLHQIKVDNFGGPSWRKRYGFTLGLTQRNKFYRKMDVYNKNLLGMERRLANLKQLLNPAGDRSLHARGQVQVQQKDQFKQWGRELNAAVTRLTMDRGSMDDIARNELRHTTREWARRSSGQSDTVNVREMLFLSRAASVTVLDDLKDNTNLFDGGADDRLDISDDYLIKTPVTNEAGEAQVDDDGVPLVRVVFNEDGKDVVYGQMVDTLGNDDHPTLQHALESLFIDPITGDYYENYSDLPPLAKDFVESFAQGLLRTHGVDADAVANGERVASKGRGSELAGRLFKPGTVRNSYGLEDDFVLMPSKALERTDTVNAVKGEAVFEAVSTLTRMVNKDFNMKSGGVKHLTDGDSIIDLPELTDVLAETAWGQPVDSGNGTYLDQIFHDQKHHVRLPLPGGGFSDPTPVTTFELILLFRQYFGAALQFLPKDSATRDQVKALQRIMNWVDGEQRTRIFDHGLMPSAARCRRLGIQVSTSAHDGRDYPDVYHLDSDRYDAFQENFLVLQESADDPVDLSDLGETTASQPKMDAVSLVQRNFRDKVLQRRTERYAQVERMMNQLESVYDYDADDPPAGMFEGLTRAQAREKHQRLREILIAGRSRLQECKEMLTYARDHRDHDTMAALLSLDSALSEIIGTAHYTGNKNADFNAGELLTSLTNDVLSEADVQGFVGTDETYRDGNGQLRLGDSALHDEIEGRLDRIRDEAIADRQRHFDHRGLDVVVSDSYLTEDLPELRAVQRGVARLERQQQELAEKAVSVRGKATFLQEYNNALGDWAGGPAPNAFKQAYGVATDPEFAHAWEKVETLEGRTPLSDFYGFEERLRREAYVNPGDAEGAVEDFKDEIDQEDDGVHDVGIRTRQVTAVENALFDTVRQLILDFHPGADEGVIENYIESYLAAIDLRSISDANQMMSLVKAIADKQPIPESLRNAGVTQDALEADVRYQGFDPGSGLFAKQTQEQLDGLTGVVAVAKDLAEMNIRVAKLDGTYHGQPGLEDQALSVLASLPGDPDEANATFMSLEREASQSRVELQQQLAQLDKASKDLEKRADALSAVPYIPREVETIKEQNELLHDYVDGDAASLQTARRGLGKMLTNVAVTAGRMSTAASKVPETPGSRKGDEARRDIARYMTEQSLDFFADLMAVLRDNPRSAEYGDGFLADSFGATQENVKEVIARMAALIGHLSMKEQLKWASSLESLASEMKGFEQNISIHHPDSNARKLLDLISGQLNGLVEKIKSAASQKEGAQKTGVGAQSFQPGRSVKIHQSTALVTTERLLHSELTDAEQTMASVAIMQSLQSIADHHIAQRTIVRKIGGRGQVTESVLRDGEWFEMLPPRDTVVEPDLADARRLLGRVVEDIFSTGFNTLRYDDRTGRITVDTSELEFPDFSDLDGVTAEKRRQQFIDDMVNADKAKLLAQLQKANPLSTPGFVPQESIQLRRSRESAPVYGSKRPVIQGEMPTTFDPADRGTFTTFKLDEGNEDAVVRKVVGALLDRPAPAGGAIAQADKFILFNRLMELLENDFQRAQTLLGPADFSAILDILHPAAPPAPAAPPGPPAPARHQFDEFPNLTQLLSPGAQAGGYSNNNAGSVDHHNPQPPAPAPAGGAPVPPPAAPPAPTHQFQTVNMFKAYLHHVIEGLLGNQIMSVNDATAMEKWLDDEVRLAEAAAQRGPGGYELDDEAKHLLKTAKSWLGIRKNTTPHANSSH